MESHSPVRTDEGTHGRYSAASGIRRRLEEDGAFLGTDHQSKEDIRFPAAAGIYLEWRWYITEIVGYAHIESETEFNC